MAEELFNLFVFFCLLALGFFTGSRFEKQHYRSIKKRERRTHHLSVITFGAKQPLPVAQDAKLFVGSVVICADYFKIFIATLRNIVGGEVIVYESLLDRGRREALLRMKEQAIVWGADQIVNVRWESADIDGSKLLGIGGVAVEVIAYGTGIRR